MPDDLGLLSPEQGSGSKTRWVMGAVFVAAMAGIIVLTLQLPHVLRQKPPAFALFWSAAAMFVLAVVMGGVFVWFVADRFRQTTSEFRRVQGIVGSATGVDVQRPELFSGRQAWKIVVIMLAVPAIVIAIHFAGKRLFPEAPSWTPIALIWGVGAVVTVLTYRKAARAQHTAAARPSLWRALLNLTLWFLLFAVVMRFDPRWFEPWVSPKAILIILPLLCLSVPFFVWTFGFLPWLWIGRALARADYESALRRAGMLLRISPNDPGFRFLRGTVLLFAGRYAEAEQALRESAELGNVSTTYSQSSTLANLGEALMLQGRYEEAMRDYEAGARIHPGWGRAYSGMAEAYLWQGIEPERSLELLDRALERKLRTWASRRFDRHVLAHMYADRAWALALLGRTQEFRAELDKAFQIARPRFRPGIGGVHYRAGRAFLALGEKTQAREHFRRAQELDPGSSGLQAGRMLERM